MGVVITGTKLSDLKIFQDQYIKEEQGGGIEIQGDGTYKEKEMESVDNFLSKFAKFQNSVNIVGALLQNPDKVDVQIFENAKTAKADKPLFDDNGKIILNPPVCPQCGKKVKQLQKNGYCSKTCATIAKTKKSAAKWSERGEQTLERIQQLQRILDIADMVLDLVTTLPEMIVACSKLPEEYREYITIQIDIVFLKLKKYVNIAMIWKNNKIIDLLETINCGTIDDTLQVIFAPITAILQVVQAIQLALNIAVQAALAALSVPMTGIPPQSYGFFLTAKSMQQPTYSGKLLIEIVPQLNKLLPIQNMMNNINYTGIEAILKAAMPPIQDFEYFLDPALFKIRYAFSAENIPTVKKMQQFLESLVVMGCDSFPRYKRLKLTNVWFVLAILTGWGPVSQKVFGDFIFHGPM